MILLALVFFAVSILATIATVTVGVAGAVFGCLFGDVIIFFVIIVLFIRRKINNHKLRKNAKKAKKVKKTKKVES